jgi:TfoX/Sxy family transcriptional regulator of competence genes
VIRDFATVVAALGSKPGVSRGKMFGSEGLKVGKSVFAMDVKGKLIVKLSAERAAELRDAGQAEAFDPGHGRPMKQWVAIHPSSKIDWLKMSREALAFVGEGTK